MYKKITLSALLIAIAIVIPIVFAPFRVTIGPMSWTIASHVPIFIACFISPWVAVAVCAGSTIGFFFTAPNIAIVARAATHIIFALILAFYVKKVQKIKLWHMMLIAVIISVIHGLCEAIVIQLFFFPEGGMFVVWVLVGVGTFIHSMVDFWLARFIMRGLQWKS